MVRKAEPDVLRLVGFGAAIQVGTCGIDFEDRWKSDYCFVSLHRSLNPHDGEPLESIAGRNAELF